MMWIHLDDPRPLYDPPEPYHSQYQGRHFGLYDGEIAYVDQLIGEFLNFLAPKCLLDKTLIIFAAEYGESLGEYKGKCLRFFIYVAVIRVSLIIRLPGENNFQGKIINSHASSIDIMPIILDLIDVA